MFKFKKITTRDICMIAMLIAITAVLGIVSGKLRIGTFSKFSFSFIAVYLSAILYGPFVAGLVGIVGDFISAIGTGPYLWWIGLIEYAYGVIFGLIFYKEKGKFVFKVLLCTIIIGVVDIFVKSYILMSVGYAPSPIDVAILTRLPMCLVMVVVRFAVLILAGKSLSRVAALARKD